MTASSLFIAGTDTGVGKTRIASAVLRTMGSVGIKTVGMKPVASGSDQTSEGLRNEDALALMQAATVAVPYEWVNPFCFAPAIAPHIAARQVGVEVELPVLLAAHHRLTDLATVVVVEGAGGWRVPLSNACFLSELPRRAGMDVLLVVGLRLGCINHAVLSAEAIQRDGCRLVGWVGNTIDPDFAPFQDNVDTLKALLPAPCWGIVAHGATADAEQAALIDGVRGYVGVGAA